MSEHDRLARLLAPTSIAVVGANESLAMSNNAVLPMLERGRSVHMVNPKRETVYGQTTAPSLRAIGEPVDAVLALVNAERSVDLVEEAGELGCGGVVVAAAGFGEMGVEGNELQTRLIAAAAAADVAVIGPNCSGFKNVPLGVNLFTGGPLDLRAGGIAVVSQSGFLMRSALAAARDRQLGVSIAISSGNEAVCDLADHLHVLVDDPTTTVICLVVETVRRPEAFFDAVARARAAAKPVIALKLGRGDRARDIIESHTGAIADARWVYDVAFREHGVIAVEDIDELLDAALLVGQLAPARRTSVERIGVITTSGGVAASASDLADDERVPVPPLEELGPWVRERVPGSTVNPLDLTGFVVTKPELTEELFARYADAVDVLVVCWWIGDGDEAWSRTLLEPLAAVAAGCDTPCVVTPLESTSVGPWVDSWRDHGLVFGRGLRSVYRALRAMHAFETQPARETAVGAPDPASSPPALVDSEIGPLVPFSDAMRLLADAGIPVAPHATIAAGDDPGCELAELGARLVVKLADVPHRTELDAVSLDVAPGEVAAEVARLRDIARTHGVPETVVVQPMLSGRGEAFTGLQCETDLGPVVLLGGGGVLVEVSGGVAGRMLPAARGSIASLVDEVAGPQVFADLRGQQAWPTSPLVDAVAGMHELWRRHGAWLRSVDVNPLIVTDDGVVAVDALLVASKDGVSP